jgi:hypothetical protein
MKKRKTPNLPKLSQPWTPSDWRRCAENTDITATARRRSRFADICMCDEGVISFIESCYSSLSNVFSRLFSTILNQECERLQLRIETILQAPCNGRITKGNKVETNTERRGSFTSQILPKTIPVEALHVVADGEAGRQQPAGVPGQS